MKTINNYAKKIAEKSSGKIYENTHTTGYYLKEILEHGGGGGGGGSYDDTEIKRRITAVENNKQNKLTAGQNITIDANTIAAREIIDDTINSTTTVWSSKKVKDLIEALEGGAKVSIVATRPDPSVAEEKTMYYVGTSAPFHIWFFVNDTYTDVGTTDINLENYFTKAEVNALLAGKVDKETGKVLIPTEDLAQITTNKTDIVDLKEEKQDKLTDSTLSTLTDSTTVSSVDATAKTNKTFALSVLWDWIVGKLTSNTEKGIQISSGKLGHSNAITVPTAKRILQATYDEQGHVTNIETEFNWSDNYANSAENQLFTQKGANAMYTALKYSKDNSVIKICDGLEIHIETRVSVPQTGTQTKNFAAAFPNNCWAVIASPSQPGYGADAVIHCSVNSKSQYKISQAGGAAAMGVTIIAFGN